MTPPKAEGQEAPPQSRGGRAIAHCQQVLTEESRLLLAAIVRDEMKVAIADGIAAAMTEEAAERFWNKGLEVLQRQAKEAAGDFLLDGLAITLKKLLWVGVFAAVVYSVGGWTLLKTMWTAITRG